QSCEAKIGKVRFAFCIQQNVCRLDVPMQNTVFMRVVNGARHPGDEFPRPPGRNRRVFNYLVKLAAFDKLHAEVALAIALADLINWDDARVSEARGSFAF